MTTTIFQAANDGNVELVSSLLDQPSLEIDARDEAGLTALQYAVRAGHIQVVSQLLAQGANALEVVNDDALKQNPELAAVVNNALQHTQSTAFQTAPVVDSHGGKQLPDGTVSYVQPPSYQNDGQQQQHQQQQHLVHQHPMSHPAYPFQPQHAFFDPSHNPEHRAHAAKDSSSGSLPPPEVARMIPCRFFPNCRYGEKCIFAHPVPVPAASSSAGPVSPGQAPMFFQSHTYGYPAYGPPQHFYSMAPPMPLQYAGVPMPVHMPPPPHMAPNQHSADGDSYGHQFASHPRQQLGSQQPAQEGQSGPAATEASPDAAAPAAVAVQADTEASKADSASDAKTAPKNSAESAKPASATASPATATTTSFSAFMAHHAAPFQPGPAQNGVSVGADGSFLTGSQPTTRGTKGARRGGASMGGNFGQRSELGKRSSERPACLFFARSACKHGEDCRFPHILPDGTDARGPNAGRSNHSIEASRAINRALAAKNAKASNNNNHNNNNNSNNSNTNNSAKESSSAGTAANGENSGLPATPRDVSVSTSPASAQTTITASNQKNDSTSKPSADRTASRADAADKSTAAAASAPAKKEATAKSNAAAGSSTATKSSGPNAASAGKSEAKAENNSNGKRAAASAKSDEAKPAAAAPAGQGDRIPASIPSKPMVNGNGSNGAANRQNGAKPQANGVQAGKGNHNQNGARSRANQGSNGRANGQGAQGAAGQKKPAPQRLPNADDFPALTNGQGQAAAAPAPVAAAPANGAPKVNFSAILSAPAPVKKQPEPTKETETAAAADDKPAATPAANGEAKEAGESADDADAKTSAPKQASTNASGAAAPMMDFAAVVQSNPVAV
ncbi:uncharacterized protein PAN0_001c0070 [Moesziomyces antarcticus]|uniref:C3H1-type domain-containing protein n=1 Tax=Pseudozyma antarctica TaxID=84753 RepID=A0A5C3FFD0_PSEA2|nr:uncharacterized protein PAN0_001c0070 [Moesziomyces antarcticus]GAK61875.1 conserved hypothetical protein [Moesziomyces antarcticus]SPO42395.1 uncharacterized protein PSANT_00078 [Moesziomyces antarcticus]